MSQYRTLWHRRTIVAAALLLLLPVLLLLYQQPLASQSDTKPPIPLPMRPGAVESSPVGKGEPVSPRQGYIVGGEPAAVGELPWQVVVYPGPYLCGGTLIDDDWVLTAAHCVVEDDGSPMAPAAVSIIAGEYRRDQDDGTEQERNVTNVIVHPSYNPRTSDNDIALLRLASAVDLTQASVGVIPLVNSPANDGLVAPGILSTVSGWGTTSSGGSSSSVLRKVQVPLVSNADCNSDYGGGITDNMICAGYDAGGKDSCQGDSGGPLVVPDGSGWRLAGVVSFGNGCALPNYPGVYTRVSRFTTWIGDYLAGGTPPTPTPTPTPIVGPTATPNPNPSVDALRNGDFELGNNGDWNEFSSNGYDLIMPRAQLDGLIPHSGDWVAWLGGIDSEESVLTQELRLDGSRVAANGDVTLSYYYQIYSADFCGYDSGEVTVEVLDARQGMATHATITTYDLCSSKEVTSWTLASFDLSAYVGHLIRLRFSVSTDSSGISNLFIDDAQVSVAGGPTPTPLPPTPTPTATPTTTPQPPTIDYVDPDQGLSTVPNEVTLYGANLQPGMLVRIDGTALKDVTVNQPGASEARAIVPSGIAAGTHDVVAQNPGSTSSTLADGYTVLDPGGDDLAVSDNDFWFDPAPVREGQETLVGVNVHRSGGASLGGADVAFYLDDPVNGTLLGSTTTPPLEPGIDVVEAVFVTWQPPAPGSYNLFAVVDPDGALAESNETNNVAQWNLSVLPEVPDTADTTPPTVESVVVNGGLQQTTIPTVTVALTGTDGSGSGVASMYMADRVYNAAARRWVAMQQTGWIDYAGEHTLVLAPVGGAHYIQVWVADEAGNISTAAYRVLVNYLRSGDSVLAQQVRVYRIQMAAGESLEATLATLSGDADLYVWSEAGALMGYSDKPGTEADTVVVTAVQAGLYQFEVYGFADSTYTLGLAAAEVSAAPEGRATAAKPLPSTPSVALSSEPPGQQVLPVAPNTAAWSIYLPTTKK